MSQKQITVTATNGSAVVTLSDTSGIVAGKTIFQRSDAGVPGAYPSTYIVDSIVADTSVTLTGNYGGDSGTFTGLFNNDFTANYDLPLLYSGDLNTPEVWNRLTAYVDANMVTHSNATGFDVVRASATVQVGGVSNQARVGWASSTATFEARSVSPAGPGNIELKTCNAGTVSTALHIDYEKRIITGGETTNSNVDPGGICISIPTGEAYAQAVKNADTTHPFTDHAAGNVLMRSLRTHSTNGGYELWGLSGSATPAIQLRGYRENLATGWTSSGVIDLRAYKSNGGTGSTTAADNEVIISERNGGTVVAVTYGNGDKVLHGGLTTSVEGKIVTGGEPDPIVTGGGVEIQTNTKDGMMFVGRNTEVTHPFTTQIDSDAIWTVGKRHNSEGGMHLRCYAAGNTSAFTAYGMRETLSISDTSSGAITFDFRKSDGSTSVASVADDETGLAIRNIGATVFSVKGDGSPVSQGSYMEVGGVQWHTGSGSPESSVTAPVGSFYSRTDGGTGTSWYVKESGSGNTGWVAK